MGSGYRTNTDPDRTRGFQRIPGTLSARRGRVVRVRCPVRDRQSLIVSSAIGWAQGDGCGKPDARAWILNGAWKALSKDGMETFAWGMEEMVRAAQSFNGARGSRRDQLWSWFNCILFPLLIVLYTLFISLYFTCMSFFSFILFLHFKYQFINNHHSVCVICFLSPTKNITLTLRRDDSSATEELCSDSFRRTPVSLDDSISPELTEKSIRLVHTKLPISL